MAKSIRRGQSVVSGERLRVLNAFLARMADPFLSFSSFGSLTAVRVGSNIAKRSPRATFWFVRRALVGAAVVRLLQMVCILAFDDCVSLFHFILS